MRLEEIGTKYIVAEDIFPKTDNRVSEFFFFKDEESARKFYDKKRNEIKDEIKKENFIGFETKNFGILDKANDFMLVFEENSAKGSYCLRYIDNSN